MSDTQKNTTTAYVVAIVFSQWPLGQICAFLEDEVGACQEQIGFMRIDRFKGKETNRTILLLERSLYEAADTRGLTRHQRGTNFKIAEYELREHNYPKDGYTRNFYIPLPENLQADEGRAQLQNKLDVLVKFGVFSEDKAPRLKIPLESRETGKHRGQAFVTFARDTPDDAIALSRVLLHDTRLYTGDEEFDRMCCFWAKESKRKNSPNKGKGKNKGKNNQNKGKGKNNRGPKKARKAAPTKKGLVKTNTVAKKVLTPAPVKTTKVLTPALVPEENKWDKPLVSTETEEVADEVTEVVVADEVTEVVVADEVTKVVVADEVVEVVADEVTEVVVDEVTEVVVADEVTEVVADEVTEVVADASTNLLNLPPIN